MANKIYRDLLAKVSKETKEFVENSSNIAIRISDILNQKNISQRDFALLLDKDESEISKWLSGTHNFTIKTISKIEVVLDIKIINTKFDYTSFYEIFWISLTSVKFDTINNSSHNIGYFHDVGTRFYINLQNENVFSGDLKSNSEMSLVDSNTYRRSA